MLFFFALNKSSVQADDLLNSSKFFQQLSAPLNLVIEGQSFRESILTVAQQADINVWIDRQVDPSAPVSPGNTGPNVYAALKSIAAERDCVVMPTANVLLIGRPDWVDGTAAALIACKTSLSATTIQWGPLTTPTQAFTVAAGDKRPSKVNLPHDLWPSTKLQMVKPPIAANLILSQFGRHLSSTKTMDPMTSLPNQTDTLVTRAYTDDESTKAAFESANKQPNFKSTGNKLFVTALAADHRIAANKLFAPQGNNAANQKLGRNDPRQFSLKIENKPAAVAIKSFAGNANAKCVITFQAAERAEQLVTFDATGKTLAELIDITAAKVGLVANWPNDTTVTIDLAN